MTFTEIFWICLLKAVVMGVLAKLGWLPDWEARARKREEHKRVLRAYEEWCERTGARPASDPRFVDKSVAKANRKFGAIKK